MKKKTRVGALVMALVFTLALLAGCQQETLTAQRAASVAASSAVQAASTAAVDEGTANEPVLSAEAVETLNSLEKVDENFYYMDYKADYALDSLLAKGAASEQELDDFISQQMLGGLPFNQKAPIVGCSAFTAATPDGEYIMGRNFDIADAQNTLVHTKPENGYESLATASGMVLGYVDHMPGTVLGRLFMLAAPYFVVDGINEKGLSAAILLLYASPPVNQDTGKISITTTITIRMLLDKAATVEEGIELMAQHDMHSIGNSNLHFQLADATGDSAVIEYVNGEMRVLRSEANGQAVTNFFLSADVKEEYRDGEDRITILQAALDENKGIVTAEKAMQMLESVKAVHDFDQLSGMDYNTSYSIVFNNTTHSMDVCANMNYETVYSFEVRGGH